MPTPVAVWPVDDLGRVFLGDLPPADAAAQAQGGWHLHAAGGEYCSLQVGLRTCVGGAEVDYATLSVTVDPPRSSAAAIGPERTRIRWAQSVPIPSSSLPASEIERPGQVPGWYPDPLVDYQPPAKGIKGEPFSIGVHITLHIPRSLPAGIYRGAVKVKSKDREVASLPLVVEVWPFAIPAKPTFHVTNWFRGDFVCQWHHCEPWSARHWRLLEHYARDLAEHRQDTIYTPQIFDDYYMHQPRPLVDITRQADDTLTFDMTRLERWVELFDRHGLALFELCHCLSYVTGQYAPPFSLWDQAKAERVFYGRLAAEDPFYRRLMAAFLRHLSGWLDRRGLTDRFLLHVFDEPSAKPAVWEHYAKTAAFIHGQAPGLRVIDAISRSDLLTKNGAQIDIPVPLTTHLEDEDGYYRARARRGEPVWWYTCGVPLGRYANRFICRQLMDGRMLFWQAYAFGITGYLHWGYNHWCKDVRLTREPDSQGWLPPQMGNPYCDSPMPDAWDPGDSHIVYPPGGWWDEKGPVSSLRWEAMRAGLQDYELLKMLEARLNSGPAGGEAAERGRAALAQVKGPFAGSLTNFSRDRGQLQRLRQTVGDAVAALL